MGKSSIQSNALNFARENRKRIAKEFTDTSKYPPDTSPVSVFMAGSPGAGKTEFSKNIISMLEKSSGHRVVRIDVDDIRPRLPGYAGNNSYLFQGAISLIVEKLHDYVLAQKQSFVLDGTFSNQTKAVDNVKRSLRHNRSIYIFYIYQNPIIAWNFTKKRELIEGRNIPKKSFVEQFLYAQTTVNHIRKNFGEEVNVFLVKKDFTNKTVEKPLPIKPGKKPIDEYIKKRYTQTELENIL